MQSIIDSIQTIARQRARGDDGPLLLLRQLDGRAGERISHLAIDSDLSQAWQAFSGEPFRPHQAHALSGLRRGEPVALRAANAAVAMTGHLLLYAALAGDRASAGLIIVPDLATGRALTTTLAHANAHMPARLRLPAVLIEPHTRPPRDAQIFITTPDMLHHRLLRFHERGWNLFWRQLRFVLLPDLHGYNGVAGAHLADLLLRLQRVADHTSGNAPDILATLADLADPQTALTSMLGYQWRVVAADDLPSDAVTMALWRGSVNRLREAAEVAMAVQREGYHVHIRCAPLEELALAPMLGDAENITFGANDAPAQVLISAGYPGSTSQLRRLLRSHYQAVIVVLGDLPHEQMLARHSASLLNEPPTVWPELPANAYVTAQHILCAASELALTGVEVDAWGVSDIVERLVAHEQLVDLPDPELAWKPTSSVDDPYAEFSMLSSSGNGIRALNEQREELGWLDPTGFERWTFTNAALPPGVGGTRVVARDEETGSVTLRLENNGRRTYPLRRDEVTVREERETRAFNSQRIGLGRVVVDETVYGYREMTSAGVPGDVALKPELEARWTATACWFELPNAIQPVGQLVGWSLVAALPLRVLAAFGDVVPCYSHAKRRLYIVDTQPGGNGLAAWLYTNAEQLLPLAYDIALACRADPLLEPLSRVDMDWLLAFLGRRAETPAPVAERPQFVAGPPPAQHPERADEPARILLTPAPQHPEPAPRQPPEPDTPKARATKASAATRRAPPNQRDKRIRVARASTRAAAARQEREPEPDDQPPDQLRLPERADAPPPPAAPQIGKPQREQTAPPPAAPQISKPAPAAPPAPAERLPDASSLIERLQRQRQRREAEQERTAPAPPPRPPVQSADVEPRFAAGDTIFCLPYGDGVVQESRVADGRELLTVTFPQHGDLEIDPALSLVRKINAAPPDDDDLL